MINDNKGSKGIGAKRNRKLEKGNGKRESEGMKRSLIRRVAKEEEQKQEN